MTDWDEIPKGRQIINCKNTVSDTDSDRTIFTFQGFRQKISASEQRFGHSDTTPGAPLSTRVSPRIWHSSHGHSTANSTAAKSEPHPEQSTMVALPSRTEKTTTPPQTALLIPERLAGAENEFDSEIYMGGRRTAVYVAIAAKSARGIARQNTSAARTCGPCGDTSRTVSE